MNRATPFRVAFDASAWPAGHGIGRYLRALLPRMIEAGGERWQWTAYARRPLDARAGVETRSDGWPDGPGRIASLFLTQPAWARRDLPTLYWGPAHRLPARLPATTASVVTIHDLCWREAPHTMRPGTRWLDRIMMPIAVRRADRVIAVSGASRITLAEAFPSSAGKVRVVHEASDALPAPAPRAQWSRYVLAVGTIEPRKNLERLCQAVARVPGVRLVLAGAMGWGMPSPDRIARQAGLADRCTWLGAVDDATLSTLYAHAECLAMPSLYEGFGLPLLEALSHGTPVLYGNNSSMPEVAGDAGIGVDANGVDSIADGLRRLLAQRGTFATRAKAQAAKFSWDRAARETLAVFEEAIAARQARRA